MKFDKSWADQILEFVKGWANPFIHGESLIHISYCVEALHKVENDLLSADTVGLEKMKRFWDKYFKSSNHLKKSTCPHSNTWLQK